MYLQSFMQVIIILITSNFFSYISIKLYNNNNVLIK